MIANGPAPVVEELLFFEAQGEIGNSQVCGRIEFDPVGLLGTLHLLDAAGHDKDSDFGKLKPFAALMIGPFHDVIAADPDIGKQ